MAMPTNGADAVARSEPRTRTALLLESIALRHQIAVLERSRTRRPCCRRIDRLLWLLLSCWWPQWRESLVIVQPEAVLHWRRNGWSAIWRYRSRGRWRGGRPRGSGEGRDLIARVAVPTENSENSEKSRVLRVTALMLPACLSSCVQSSRFSPADFATGRSSN